MLIASCLQLCTLRADMTLLSIFSSHTRKQISVFSKNISQRFKQITHLRLKHVQLQGEQWKRQNQPGGSALVETSETTPAAYFTSLSSCQCGSVVLNTFIFSKMWLITLPLHLLSALLIFLENAQSLFLFYKEFSSLCVLKVGAKGQL